MLGLGVEYVQLAVPVRAPPRKNITRFFFIFLAATSRDSTQKSIQFPISVPLRRNSFLKISREMGTQSSFNCAYNIPRPESFPGVCHLPIWFPWFWRHFAPKLNFDLFLFI